MPILRGAIKLKIEHSTLNRYFKQCHKKGDKLIAVIFTEPDFDDLRNIIYELEAFSEGFHLAHGKESTILSTLICDLKTEFQNPFIKNIEVQENASI